MDVVSVPPIRSGCLVWQPRTGAFAFTFVAKVTFALVPGEAEVAEDQEDVHEHDQHWNGDKTRGVYAASDLAPRKTRADVTLVGNAFAPGGEPVRSLVARLVVGALEKPIEVWGDRSISREGVVRDAARFARMPLRYERAAGGPGTANPVGVRTGRSASPDVTGAVMLPNLQPVGATPRRDDPIDPIGFGPVPSSFPLRRDKLGRYTIPARIGDTPLPDDFDFGYFNVAPADQQLAALQEAERIVLQNLHREHPTLRTALPGARPRAFVERDGAPPREAPMRCDALWIDTDRAVCAVLWRGELPLGAPDERGRVLLGLETRGARLRHEDLVAQTGGSPSPRPRPAPAVMPSPVVMASPIVSAAPAPIVEMSSDELEPAPVTTNLPASPHTQPGFVETARMPAFRPSEALPFVRSAPPPKEPRRRVITQIPVGESGPSQEPAWLQVTPPAALARPLPVPVAPRFGPTEPVARVWHERAAAGRIRAAFLDPSRRSADGDPQRAASDVALALVVASPATPAMIDEAVANATSEGRFQAPLLAVAGELRFAFDEVEALRLTVSAAMPFVTGDPRLREAVDLARELLSTTWLVPTSSVAEGLAQRVRDAFAQSGRPAAYLGGLVDRALLERRAYQRRVVLGEDRIRAMLAPAGGDPPRPAYLPVKAAAMLPMFPSFEARLLVEVHPSQDHAEPSPWALRALAIGRVLRRGRAE